MNGSAAYLAILGEGRAKGLREERKKGRKTGREEESRRIPLGQGNRRFGTLPSKFRQLMSSIFDIWPTSGHVMKVFC